MSFSTDVYSFAIPTETGGFLVEVDPDLNAADDILFFTIASKRYRRITDGVYRAAWVVNGASDQTSRLQAVFNSSAVSEVVFDNNDVTVNGTLTIPAGKKISFSGNGKIIGTGTINGGIYRFKRPEFFGSSIITSPEHIYNTSLGKSIMIASKNYIN